MKVLRAVTLALTLSLAACMHPGPATDAGTGSGLTIEKVEAAYTEAKAFADLLLPYLPASRIVQIAELKRKIEAALAAAKAARTVAEQLHALTEARDATTQLDVGE